MNEHAHVHPAGIFVLCDVTCAADRDCASCGDRIPARDGATSVDHFNADDTVRSHDWYHSGCWDATRQT